MATLPDGEKGKTSQGLLAAEVFMEDARVDKGPHMEEEYDFPE